MNERSVALIPVEWNYDVIVAAAGATSASALITPEGQRRLATDASPFALEAAVAAYDHDAWLKQQAIAEIKQRARADVEALAEDWQQRSLALDALLLIRKAVNGLGGRNKLTAEEQAQADKLLAIAEQIQVIRQRSDDEEAALDAPAEQPAPQNGRDGLLARAMNFFGLGGGGVV